MQFNLDTLHLNICRNMYYYFLKKKLLELLCTITGTAVNSVDILEQKDGFSILDTLLVDNNLYYIANLTETPYFDEVFDVVQLLGVTGFTVNGLDIEKTGLEAGFRSLTNR